MSAVSSSQSNYFAENGINFTTNNWWFTQMGQRVGLFQEETTGTGNHSMYRLTDMLALGHALEKLAPDLSIEALNQIVSSGSHIAKGSLEGVLDAVRRFIHGTNIESLPASDDSDSDKGRVKFHETLANCKLTRRIGPWKANCAFSQRAPLRRSRHAKTLRLLFSSYL